MEISEYSKKLDDFIVQEDLISLGNEASALKMDFDDALNAAEKQEQIMYLEAKEKGIYYEKKEFKDIRDQFYSNYKKFNEKRKVQLDLKTTLEVENLKLKKDLINKLKEVIANEEKIGSAFNSYKEIHETWKKIGEIPREKRDEIQKEYSRLLEMFFYNIKIYKELKDHDFKRNLQLKQDLIFKLKNLRNSQNSLRDLESTLRNLQNEWEEIGPVPNEEWEIVKKSYWDVVRSIYEKINVFYEEQRNSLIENISKKKSLIESMHNINSGSLNYKTPKDWDIATKKVLEIQESWKKIGFGTKKENDAVWKEFRILCDQFFENKKQYSRNSEDVFRQNAYKKQKLIEEIDLLKSSTDWKTTTEKIISIQKRWKEIASAGPRWENKLWSKFRASCDEFFTSKENHLKEQDIVLENNVLEKNALIDELSNFILPEDKQEALRILKEFSNRFANIGHVPRKEQDLIYKNYKTVLEQKYDSIQLEDSEREKIHYQSKVDLMLLSPDRNNLLAKEKIDIKRQIDSLSKEISLLENNLGFFAKSKGADQLKMEVEKKVKIAHDKIVLFKKKLSMLPNE